MSDQAQNLRDQIQKTPLTNRVTKVITVTSGKGGVGKSNFTLNFALSLIEMGQKAVIIDADLGLANIDVLMGVSPRYNLLQMVEQRRTIWDIIEQGPGGLEYIAGTSGFSKLSYLDDHKISFLFEQLGQLQGYADIVIIDTGAGLSKESLQFILSADEVILVTTPEPTAITDAYAILKMVHSKNPLLRAHLVVNRAVNEKEGKGAADRIAMVAKQFLGLEIPLLGLIVEDGNVPKAVKKQEPFYLAYPNSAATEGIKRLTQQYIHPQENIYVQNGGIKGFLQKMLKLIK